MCVFTTARIGQKMRQGSVHASAVASPQVGEQQLLLMRLTIHWETIHWVRYSTLARFGCADLHEIASLRHPKNWVRLSRSEAVLSH